jgi:2,3-bisphosphoglycerate-independent phosphoglycerate mutase
VTADHGNAEELLDKNGKLKTSHTTNKVPCIICDDTVNRSRYELAPVANPGLSNIASTISVLLGFEDYPKSWNQSLIAIE